MNKPLTIEKIQSKVDQEHDCFLDNRDYNIIEESIKLARQGMVPTTYTPPNMIAIPPEDWPDWAKSARVVFFLDAVAQMYKEDSGSSWYIESKISPGPYIFRPIPEWRPKHDDPVWCFTIGANVPELFLHDSGGPDVEKGEMFAAFHDVNEIRWTRERFRERGEIWEVKS